MPLHEIMYRIISLQDTRRNDPRDFWGTCGEKTRTNCNRNYHLSIDFICKQNVPIEEDISEHFLFCNCNLLRIIRCSRLISNLACNSSFIALLPVLRKSWAQLRCTLRIQSYVVRIIIILSFARVRNVTTRVAPSLSLFAVLPIGIIIHARSGTVTVNAKQTQSPKSLTLYSASALFP